jgi:hypothetical protein
MIILLSIPYYIYCILDVMVSLKYETDGTTSISNVSGKDLSIPIKIYLGLTIFSFILFVVILIYRKRIIKK